MSDVIDDGEGTFHRVPTCPEIWGGTCLRVSVASPPMSY